MHTNHNASSLLSPGESLVEGFNIDLYADADDPDGCL